MLAWSVSKVFELKNPLCIHTWAKTHEKKRASEEIVSSLQIKSLQSLSAAAVYKHVELLLH